MIRCRLGFFLLAIVFVACSTDDSDLLTEEARFDYYADCERNFAFFDKEGGKLQWSLSHVGCIVYNNGEVERPQYRPIVRDEILLFDDASGTSYQSCDTTVKGRLVYADCPRESDPVYLGRLNDAGRVELDSRLAVNVTIPTDAAHVVYDHEVHDDETVQTSGQIGIAFRSAE